MRSTSLRAAKSTTAKPLRLESCTKIRRTEPSGAFSIAIGRTPSSSWSCQAIFSVARSITVSTLLRIEPVITYLLSGVTYTLCRRPFTGIVLATLSSAVSITSSAPGSSAMPTTTRPPSFVVAMLFG